MTTAIPSRVLVVGSGSIAQRHTRNLLSLGVAEVVVVTARDVTGVEPFADPGVTVFAEIPADCPPVAIVANDTDRHLATCLSLAEKGVHILAEKPLASAPSPELDRLCEMMRDSGLVGRVAYNLRFLGALQAIDRMLVAGELGKPLFARLEVGQWLPDWRPGRPVEELYSATAERGGGVALDLSHEIDYMTMLFGYPRRWNVLSSHTGALPIGAADVFDGQYAYDSGFSCTVHLDYIERQPRRMIRIVATAGVVECDIVSQKLKTVTADGESTTSGQTGLFDVQATYLDEVTSFFAEVAGQAHSDVRLPTFEEGRDVLRLLADESLTDGAAHDGWGEHARG